MQLAVEILDHIFSFLRVSHLETLVACSKDPVLSLVVTRHLYYHIIVDLDEGTNSEYQAIYTIEPDRLSKVVAEDPHILHHVRILQIQVFEQVLLHKFASTLLMFPVLECIRLIAPTNMHHEHLPGRFRDALRDRIGLPTIKEVHIRCWMECPFSLLDNGKNIESLSLSGYFNIEIPYRECYASSPPPLPQLKTLRLLTPYIHPWIKSHIHELRSLKCRLSSGKDLSKLLSVCSDSLNTLDIDLTTSPYYTGFFLSTGETVTEGRLSELSLPSLNLHQLTIRTRGELTYMNQRCFISCLPAAADLIKLFSSTSLRHLVIDLILRLSTLSDLTIVDFSPLTKVLQTTSVSTPKIDLYVHTGISTSGRTRAQLLSSLENQAMVKLVQEGVLVIHSEETAPECV